MKTNKLFFLVTLFLSVLLFANCNKNENELEINEVKASLGETQKGFKVDSVYYTTTDGFLNVSVTEYGSPYALASVIAKIYADKFPNPSTEVGLVYYSTSLPLSKNTYWKVKNLMNGGAYRIDWTPIQK